MTTKPPELRLADYIRSIQDFPKPGILFRDVTPLLANPAAFRLAAVEMADPFRSEKVEVVAGAEARGFIFAAAVALELGVGLAPIRKPGKLPFHVESVAYDLEYGADVLEIHTDAIAPKARVLVVRRPFGHRRHRRGVLPAGGEARRHRCRLLVPDRTGRPARRGANREVQNGQPGQV